MRRSRDRADRPDAEDYAQWLREGEGGLRAAACEGRAARRRKPASLDEAIAAAAALIKAARLPAFGGLATDVDGMRAIMSIADKARGVVDHAYSEAQGVISRCCRRAATS